MRECEKEKKRENEDARKRSVFLKEKEKHTSLS